ncbi:hypothetical protein WN48_01567 [Eufriesea mexicana]|nr:hypothetical protein WN48_01567 [Eufriesea mexicana]
MLIAVRIRLIIESSPSFAKVNNAGFETGKYVRLQADYWPDRLGGRLDSERRSGGSESGPCRFAVEESTQGRNVILNEMSGHGALEGRDGNGRFSGRMGEPLQPRSEILIGKSLFSVSPRRGAGGLDVSGATLPANPETRAESLNRFADSNFRRKYSTRVFDKGDSSGKEEQIRLEGSSSVSSSLWIGRWIRMEKKKETSREDREARRWLPGLAELGAVAAAAAVTAAVAIDVPLTKQTNEYLQNAINTPYRRVHSGRSTCSRLFCSLPLQLAPRTRVPSSSPLDRPLLSDGEALRKERLFESSRMKSRMESRMESTTQSTASRKACSRCGLSKHARVGWPKNGIGINWDKGMAGLFRRRMADSEMVERPAWNKHRPCPAGIRTI